MDNKQILMQEYIQLREELRLYLSRKSRYEIILAAICVIMAVSSSLKEPLPVLLMSALPIFLIEDQTRRIDAIYRIASYIRVHIEPFVECLNWETYGTKLLRKRSLFSFSSYALDIIILSILFIIQFVFAASIWISNTPNTHFLNNTNSWFLYPIGTIYLIALVFFIFRFNVTSARTSFTRKCQDIVYL